MVGDLRERRENAATRARAQRSRPDTIRHDPTKAMDRIETATPGRPSRLILPCRYRFHFFQISYYCLSPSFQSVQRETPVDSPRQRCYSSFLADRHATALEGQSLRRSFFDRGRRRQFFLRKASRPTVGPCETSFFPFKDQTCPTAFQLMTSWA